VTVIAAYDYRRFIMYIGAGAILIVILLVVFVL
jgi:hypothetical protein